MYFFCKTLALWSICRKPFLPRSATRMMISCCRRRSRARPIFFVAGTVLSDPKMSNGSAPLMESEWWTISRFFRSCGGSADDCSPPALPCRATNQVLDLSAETLRRLSRHRAIPARRHGRRNRRGRVGECSSIGQVEVFYHTRHDFAGAIGEPSLQLNALRNSGIFVTAPLTRFAAGECGSVSARCRKLSGV